MSLAEKIYHSAEREMQEAEIKLFKRNPEAIFLDIGCGDCDLTKRIAAKIGTKNVHVVDMVLCRLDYARLLGYSANYFNLEYRLRFVNNSFDVIHLGNVIEHLSNTDLICKEIYRILKPDGYAIISTPNLASWHNLIYLARGKQPPVMNLSDEMLPEVVPVADASITEPRHRRVFTPDGLEKLLRFHGFQVEMLPAAYYPFNWLIKFDGKHSAYIIAKVSK